MISFLDQNYNADLHQLFTEILHYNDVEVVKMSDKDAIAIFTKANMMMNLGKGIFGDWQFKQNWEQRFHNIASELADHELLSR